MNELSGPTDVEFVRIDDRTFLYVASEGDSAIQIFGLDGATGTPTR